MICAFLSLCDFGYNAKHVVLYCCNGSCNYNTESGECVRAGYSIFFIDNCCFFYVRWNGYNVDDYKKIIEEYSKIEMVSGTVINMCKQSP